MFRMKSIISNTENLRNTFFTVRVKVSELLAQHTNADQSFLEDPSVDVEAIAKANGIEEIIRVDPVEIGGKHATLEEGSIIKINNTDSPYEQRFSIAHELEHYLKEKADGLIEAKKRGVSAPPITRDNDIKENILAARMAVVNSRIKKTPALKYISGAIADIVSENLGKEVRPEKAFPIVMETIFTDTFVKDAGDKLYNEEMADYFAANLLVPTERFALWQDKPIRKIANAFKVPESCIKKRTTEIPYETDFMIFGNLSSQRKKEA